MVTIKYHATSRALVSTYRYRHFLLVATHVANLTGRVPSVYADEMFASVCQFVLQHPRKHAPAIVVGRFSVAKTFVGHGLRVKILYANKVVPIGYLGTAFL